MMIDINASISRPRLESLSTSELARLADNCGIDIPPGLERIFIIEELLEYSNSIEQEPIEELEVVHSYSETAALPKQYNISYIEVIIRDPLWVFVFWEIKSHDREINENAKDFNGYTLRVIPLNDKETEPTSAENSFTVPVNSEDNARYIGFAEHSSQGSNRYIIKLAAIRGETELQLAVSAPFNLPMLMENEKINNMNQNYLIHLSGIQDISTTKSTDRQSRNKRQ